MILAKKKVLNKITNSTTIFTKLYKLITMLKVHLKTQTMWKLTSRTKVPKSSPKICRANSFFIFILLIALLTWLMFAGFLDFCCLCRDCDLTRVSPGSPLNSLLNICTWYEHPPTSSSQHSHPLLWSGLLDHNPFINHYWSCRTQR